jgi:hypothetical protein
MTIPSYATAADISQNLPDVTLSEDYLRDLEALAIRASRIFDMETKRRPGAYAIVTDEVLTFIGSGKSYQPIDELAAAPTLVEVDEDFSGNFITWLASDYYLWPANALTYGEPYRRLVINPVTSTKSSWARYTGYYNVRITGPFGFSQIAPEPVKQAVIIIATRLFIRGQQGYRDAAANAELGQTSYVKAIDPEARVIMEDYMKKVEYA